MSVIGAGNYASRMLIPSFAKAGARFHTIAASNGTGPVHVGRKFGFRYASTDVRTCWMIQAVMLLLLPPVMTAASLVQQSLVARKHVFVEKPFV